MQRFIEVEQQCDVMDAWMWVPWQCECTDSAPQPWSSMSAHGESLAPPRNLSRKKKKHTKAQTEIMAPRRLTNRTKIDPRYFKLMTEKDLCLICYILQSAQWRFQVYLKLDREFCLVKSPVFESRAKVCRQSWQLWAETSIRQSRGNTGQTANRNAPLQSIRN